jgi:hypothetical protein
MDKGISFYQLPSPLKFIIIKAALFFSSLVSFYNYELQLAVFPIVSLFLFVILLPEIKFDNRFFLRFIHIWFFISLFTLYAVFSSGKLSVVLATFVITVSLLGMYVTTPMIDIREMIYNSFAFVLLMHICFFYFQVSYWVFTNDVIDLVNYFGLGIGEKFSSSKAYELNGQRVPRFMGLYNEPGTYSSYIFAAMTPLFSTKRYFLLKFFSFLTLIMNASLYGFIFFCLSILLFLLNYKKIKIIIFFAFVLSFLAIFFGDILADSILLRIFDTQLGFNAREDALMRALSLEVFLCGSLCGGEAIRYSSDISIYLVIYLSGGFIFLIYFLYIVFSPVKISSGFIYILAPAMVLAAKLKILSPFFWLVIFSFVVMRSVSNKKL